MSSSASDLLKFEKQATGENASTWGTKANTAMSRIEEAIAGYRNITVAGSTYTLDDTQYSENSTTTSESHLSFIKCSGTPGAVRLIAIPARTKHYTFWNNVTTYDVTIGISGNTLVTLLTGQLVNVFCDGTNTYATGPTVSTAGGTGGGGGWLGEGASGSSVGNSGDIIRVNQQTLDTSQTMVATDNGSAAGPFSVASGVTLTIASGATFTVI